MYPGVGTFVLIRPAQTFYERINLHLAGAAAGILVTLINTEWRSGDRHRDEWLAAALNAVLLPVPLGYLYLGARMRLIGSFITRTILVVIGSLILLASIFGAAGPGTEALMLTPLGTLLLAVALNTWGAYRLAAARNREFGTQTSHRTTLIGAIAGAGISFAAVAGQAFFGGSASATEVLAVFGLPALTFGAGAGAFMANALGRMGALGTVGAFAGLVYVLSLGLPAYGVPWSGM